ncbi:MAG: oxygen-dependent coproporphyrinogen oxidase [Sphingobacteriaceae bacterium]|nr:oxygen-dependent coproporphyrinogen oxidase [Sphingobacteriaceae bacterium]
MFRNKVEEAYKRIQDEICLVLEQIDGKGKFVEEIWQRDGGGGGRTRIMQNGNVIEKGGVNFSAVHGKLPEPIKKAFKVDSDDFFATGVSIVMHTHNPFVPIIHMNIRYFEVQNANETEPAVRWFGGGIDLTPHYIIDEDAIFFHQQLKNTCDKFDNSFYENFKNRADDYFFIKHREETRGVGGIFYDRLTNENTKLDWQQLLEYSIAVGNTFAPTYGQLINKNRDKPFTPENQEWQYLRRSRYAEFNLVYDAGTKFGLETNGRIESILMSLPPLAKWNYNPQIIEGSLEAETQSKLKKGINWV